MKIKKMICLLLSILSMVCLLSACGKDNAETTEQGVIKMDGEFAMTLAQIYSNKSKIDNDCPLVDTEDFEWTKSLYRQVDETTFDVKLYGNISGYTDFSHVHYRTLGFCANVTVHGPSAEVAADEADAFYDELTFSNYSIDWFT